MRFFRLEFLNHEQIVAAFLIILALLFRLVNFDTSFNFSSDQGAFSRTALEQWETRQLALIGPPFSFHIGERVIYQGPFIYYLQTLFLILGNWNPQNASLVFTVLSCLMLIPLYFGTKHLISQKAAVLLCVIYALNPFYILYTKFLWNPNYQLALLPIIIWLMGQYQRKSQSRWLLLIGLMAGLLLQLHYQLFLGLILLLGYYIFWKKIGWIKLGLMGIGGLIAFLPFIYYELTHKFYNLNNLIFFLSHRDILYLQNKDQSSFAPHYYLSLSLIICLIIVALLKNKIKPQLTLVVGSLFLLLSAYIFIPVKTGAYGMAEHWNYQDEVKVNQIIKNQQLEDFNLVNLEYDSLYHVQKYLLKKDQILIDESNYYDNQYLFVVSKNADLFAYPAYEIQSFQPSKIINTWEINQKYKLYLLQREVN